MSDTAGTVFCWETGEVIKPDPKVDYSLLGAQLMAQIKPRTFDEQMAILRGASNDA